MAGSVKKTQAQVLVVPDTESGWSESLLFDQFDPSLGVLKDVLVSVINDVSGTALLENLSPTPTALEVDLASWVRLTVDGVQIGAAGPSTSGTATLGARDGAMDFAGPAAGTITLGSSTQGGDIVESGLAPFVGTGSVTVVANNTVAVTETGNANLRTLLQSEAGATISLQYEYEPAAGSGGPYGSDGSSFLSTTIFVPIGPTLTTDAQTYTIDNAVTGWTRVLPVQQFNPVIGDLVSVNLVLNGRIIGALGVENLGASPTQVSITERAQIAALLPDGPALSVTPSFTDSMFLTGFDGWNNFAGTSGRIDLGLSGAPVQASVADGYAATLAAFTGSGTYGLSISAIGSSTQSGGGNYLSQLAQQAGATLTVSYTYVPRGSFGSVFVLNDTGQSAVSLACFVTGTRIATPSGPVAVEDLAVGGTVITQSGRAAPISWIGHRTVACVHHVDPRVASPIRVRAGAFAARLPERDLLLSPEHAIAIGGVLIPVGLLVNGSSIVRTMPDRVTYWHVELDRHDVLLAEGLPVESFLDTGNRSAFENGGSGIQLHPNFAGWRWEAAGCAPLVVTGPLLEAARKRLALRASSRRKPRAA